MERYTILLVEDEPIIASDSRRLLEKLGHTVAAIVSSGEAAVAAVRVLAPDVVLMDIGLPGAMDGIAAAAALRAVRDVPVIYLTSHDDHATIARAKVAEPYGFLLKPSTDRELQITIELAVYRHAAERERARLQAQVKRLEGIIPICAYCRKIRNDAGYWQQVEEYLAERTEAQFSHGICKECLARHFPASEYPRGHKARE